MRARFGGLRKYWLIKAQTYIATWMHRCDVIGAVLDKHGAPRAKLEDVIPDALHKEVLQTVVQLSYDGPNLPRYPSSG